MEEKRLFCGGDGSFGGRWRAGLSDFWNLGEKIEVGVTGVDDEGVFHGEGRDPNVIGGNGCALLTEIGIQCCAVVGGHIGRMGGSHARLLEELGQHSGLDIPAFQKKRADSNLGQDNKGDDDEGGSLEPGDNLGIARTKIDEAVTVDKEAHDLLPILGIHLIHLRKGLGP